MKRIGKIFTLFLALMLCFIGCKNNEDDSSSKKIIATFEAEADFDEEAKSANFINVYDDKSWELIRLYKGKKIFIFEGTYEGNPEKDGFVNFKVLKTNENFYSESEENYIRIKNGKFNLQGVDFIRQ